MDATDGNPKKPPSIGRAAVEVAIPLALFFAVGGLMGAAEFMLFYVIAIFITTRKAETDEQSLRAHYISLTIAVVLWVFLFAGMVYNETHP